MKPTWFAKHHDAQLIAGIPYRRAESERRWAVAVIGSILLAVVASSLHRTVFPESPDLAKTVIDGVRKLLPPQNATNPIPTPTPAPNKAPATAPTDKPYIYLDVGFGDDTASLAAQSLSLINPRNLPLSGATAVIHARGQSGKWTLWRRTPQPDLNVSGYAAITVSPPIELSSIPRQGYDQYAFSVGDFDIEFRAVGTDLITERLTVFLRNGHMGRSIEVRTKGKVVFSTPPLREQPDISATFVNTGNIGIILENSSDSVLSEPYYRVVLWPVDNPDTKHPMEWINRLAGISIMRRGAIGPFELLSEDSSRRGMEMYGYAIVTCPECVQRKAYSVGFEIGGKGWFSEVEPGFSPSSTEQFVQSLRKTWGSVNTIPQNPLEPRKAIFNRPRY